MAAQHLHVVLNEFGRTVRQCRRFADDARTWSLPGATPHINAERRDSIIELAFLRGFLAWESFLEESFILHMLGKQPRRGRPPHRYVFPPNRTAAFELTAGPRGYASWEVAADVANQATRFFRNGRPYTGPLPRSEEHAGRYQDTTKRGGPSLRVGAEEVREPSTQPTGRHATSGTDGRRFPQHYAADLRAAGVLPGVLPRHAPDRC